MPACRRRIALPTGRPASKSSGPTRAEKDRPMDASLSPATPAAPARRATAVVFFVNGFLMASWVPHVPEAKDRLDLNDATLGLALLGMALGAVAAMPLAGLRSDEHTSELQ